MNILFDQTEAQSVIFNGAAEYAQSVFLRMLTKLDTYSDVILYNLYSSKKSFSYTKLSNENLRQYKRVIPVDYEGKTLKEIIIENNINLLFITCGQSFCDLPLGNLNNLPCKVVCVIHDLLDSEMSQSHISMFQYLFYYPSKILRSYLSRIKVRLLNAKNIHSRKKQLMTMLENNDATIITVSNYSQKSLFYNYPSLKNKVKVFFAPTKEPMNKDNIKNEILRNLIETKQPYFLLVSADRILKNAQRMLNAYLRYREYSKCDIKFVTIGNFKSNNPSHISLPYLSASDLEKSYKHCYALFYPSLFEGFGYPPLEAMKYGKPVFCSNVCSMPEILGNAPIYFSPIYETDMFSALFKLNPESYKTVSERSFQQYKKVKEKQITDLDLLVNSIMSGSINE